MYKHIVFDFDGTLADSANVALKVYNDMADEYNYKKLTMDEYRNLSKLPINDRFKAIGVPYYKPWIILKLIKEAKGRYAKLLNSINLFDQIEEVLRELNKKGYIISIISTNSRENILNFLREKSLDFVNEVYSSKGLYGKVDVLKKYIKKHQIEKNDLLYVADELRDLKVCKKLNIDILSVSWGFDSYELLKEYSPTYLVSKVYDMLEVITKNKIV